MHATVFGRLEATLPVFQSRMGALLFLISALLSHGLVCYLVPHTNYLASLSTTSLQIFVSIPICFGCYPITLSLRDKYFNSICS